MFQVKYVACIFKHSMQLGYPHFQKQFVFNAEDMMVLLQRDYSESCHC